MPLLTLNSSKINYQYSIGSDNFIISEIVNSSCSYEVPIVIRDKQTLDIYFGQNYPGRGYHNELLSNGVSLFLYKPVSGEKRINNIDEYYPIEDWKNEGKVIHCLCYDEFFNKESNPHPEEIGYIYIDDYTRSEYIWENDLKEYINIEQLPQNQYSENNYSSWYNRDTLRLCSQRIYDLSEKYRDGEGDDFFLIDPDEDSLSNDIQQEISSLDTAFEFFNYLNKDIKIYSSDDFTDYFKLIPDGNIVPNAIKLKDLYPEGSYHISLVFDDGSILENLLWLDKKSLITLINSKRSSSLPKILYCGQIKLIKIYKEVQSKFKNNVIACYPRYNTDYPLNYEKGISIIQHFSENPTYYDDIISEERTLALSLLFPDFKDKTFSEIKDLLFYSKIVQGSKKIFSRYIGLPLPGTSKRSFLIYFKDININSRLELGLDFIKERDLVEIDISNINSWEDLLLLIKNEISEKGYYKCQSLEKYPDKGFLIYSYFGTIPDKGFSNIPGLNIISDKTITYDIISRETEPLKRIEFYSKTIGPNDENIKIKIEPVNYYTDRYRITISRFSYSEVYDLNLYDTPDRDGLIESLDSVINRTSRLVRCKLFKEKPDGTLWKEGDVDGKLPIGEWELRRSSKDDNTDPNSYWTALMHMTETNISEDFLCIPEIERFLRNDGSYDCNLLGYFKEYEEILKYCQTKKCQALIGNLDFPISDQYPGINESPQERTIYRTKVNNISEDKTEYTYQIFWNGDYINLSIKDTSLILLWKNTFIYNYNLDDDNYLVYFYRDMSIRGIYSRPAYYVFLNGILTGRYSSGSNDIFYVTPIEDSYVNSDIEIEFQKKKTNYLVSNNQVFFYKNYQNHSGTGLYNSSILTRFALSKVSRTIEVNKYNILGKQTLGEIRGSINNILLNLRSTYPIYQNILLSDLRINHAANSIFIRLSVYIRELIDKPIGLDIELNYIY